MERTLQRRIAREIIYHSLCCIPQISQPDIQKNTDNWPVAIVISNDNNGLETKGGNLQQCDHHLNHGGGVCCMSIQVEHIRVY